jgi:hypothetical protein
VVGFHAFSLVVFAGYGSSHIFVVMAYSVESFKISFGFNYWFGRDYI